MPTPASNHVTANDLNLHYLEAGEGEPIVLLHGFPTSSHLYRNVIPTLAKTHRVIALDVRTFDRGFLVTVRRCTMP